MLLCALIAHILVLKHREADTKGNTMFPPGVADL